LLSLRLRQRAGEGSAGQKSSGSAAQKKDRRFHNFYSPSSLEKLACGRFSDISCVFAGKKRGFCRLRPATIGASQARQAAGSVIACGQTAQKRNTQAGMKSTSAATKNRQRRGTPVVLCADDGGVRRKTEDQCADRGCRRASDSSNPPCCVGWTSIGRTSRTVSTKRRGSPVRNMPLTRRAPTPSPLSRIGLSV